MNGRWVLREGSCLDPTSFVLAGILNLTPDSFSDGGRHADPESGIRHGLCLLDDGATILDLGAESTRPYADPVPESEELSRLMPVLKGLRAARPDALLSVDTYKSQTALAALEAGAHIINDVSACSLDPALKDILVTYQPGYVLMHSQGTPQTMQRQPYYANIVDDVLHFFEAHLTELVKAGLPEDHIVLDPGIGFGKNGEHNQTLLRHLERFMVLGRPLFVGISRKSIFHSLLGLDMAQRDEATRLTTALLASRGVPYHRVHDVAGCANALRLMEAFMPSALYH